jgi:hypothetical protein
MLACRARNRENVVEGHRYVGDDDLPGSLGESFRPRPCSDTAILVEIGVCQGLLRGSLLVMARAQLAPHLPAHPEQQDSTGQKKAHDWSSCVVSAANTMRRTVAARMPIRIALLRCSFGSPAAARPMTIALSPARTKSIMMTWRKAVRTWVVKISLMRRLVVQDRSSARALGPTRLKPNQSKSSAAQANCARRHDDLSNTANASGPPRGHPVRHRSL